MLYRITMPDLGFAGLDECCLHPLLQHRRWAEPASGGARNNSRGSSAGSTYCWKERRFTVAAVRPYTPCVYIYPDNFRGH